MKTNPYLALLSLAAFSTAFSSGFASPSETEACSEAVKLSVMTDRPLLHEAKGPQDVVVRIDIKGLPKKKRVHRQPLNLSVVLDRSGSMRGAKLEQARQAAEMLVDRLGPDDIFSLVIYDTEVEVLVPPQRLRNNPDSIKRKIRRIEPGGSTALYHGVESGGRQLAEFFQEERINRVLLLSDGIANVGPSSNREIARLGNRMANDGLSVTTIGLGDDYNEDLMTALAEASDANYYYVADVEALPDVFETELGELHRIIARRITLEITFPEGVEPIEFLGRPEKISNRRSSISFSTLAAEQNREVFVSCRVDPKAARKAALPVAKVSLTYTDSATPESEGTEVKISGETSVKTNNDPELVDRSQVKAITAQAEIYRNAAVTEKAIALADAGQGAEAKNEISKQIDRLRSAADAAPAAEAESLGREIQLLQESSSQLTEEGLSKSSRKALQWNAYQRRNAKEIAPAPQK